jgi:hypothetical protein
VWGREEQSLILLSHGTAIKCKSSVLTKNYGLKDYLLKKIEEKGSRMQTSSRMSWQTRLYTVLARTVFHQIRFQEQDARQLIKTSQKSISSELKRICDIPPLILQDI